MVSLLGKHNVYLGVVMREPCLHGAVLHVLDVECYEPAHLHSIVLLILLLVLSVVLHEPVHLRVLSHSCTAFTWVLNSSVISGYPRA